MVCSRVIFVSYYSYFHSVWSKYKLVFKYKVISALKPTTFSNPEVYIAHE